MAAKKKSTATAPTPAPPQPPIPAPPPAAPAVNFSQIQDIKVLFTVRLGRTTKTLDEITDLGDQSLIELDKKVGDPVEILVNGRLFARGEVVTVSENFGVRITEIIRPLQE